MDSNMIDLGGQVPHDDRPDDFFCTLDYLLNELRVSPAALADVIEKDGIAGLDRFDRFRPFGKDTDEAKRALDAIASWYDTHDDGPMPTADEDARLGRFGWLKGALPKFGSPTTVLRDEPGLKRKYQARLRLIAALMDCIRGEGPFDNKHPLFTSDAVFVELLELKYRGFDGMGGRTLKEALKEARAAIDEG